MCADGSVTSIGTKIFTPTRSIVIRAGDIGATYTDLFCRKLVYSNLKIVVHHNIHLICFSTQLQTSDTS